jgi:glycosidase
VPMPGLNENQDRESCLARNIPVVPFGRRLFLLPSHFVMPPSSNAMRTESENAGFTTGTPWLLGPSKLPGGLTLNKRWQNPNSLFYYYQWLIRLRGKYSVVDYGKYDLILESHKEINAFTRTLLDERLLVVLNFSAEPAPFRISCSVTTALDGTC